MGQLICKKHKKACYYIDSPSRLRSKRISRDVLIACTMLCLTYSRWHK